MFSMFPPQQQQQPSFSSQQPQQSTTFMLTSNSIYRPKLLYIDINKNTKCGSCGKK